MDAKKFAWVYLIENGEAGIEQSYYGGTTLKDTRVSHLYSNSWTVDHRIRSQYLEEIKTIGVDWRRTAEPQNNEISLFTDTFHDPERKEVIEGTIVLNNGLTQSRLADKLEISSVFEIMASVSEFTNKYKLLFGENS